MPSPPKQISWLTAYKALILTHLEMCWAIQALWLNFIPVHSKYLEQLWICTANTFLSKRNTLFFVFCSIHLCQIFTPRKSICSLYLPDGNWLAWMLIWQPNRSWMHTIFLSYPSHCCGTIFQKAFAHQHFQYWLHKIYWRSLYASCITLNTHSLLPRLLDCFDT